MLCITWMKSMGIARMMIRAGTMKRTMCFIRLYFCLEVTLRVTVCPKTTLCLPITFNTYVAEAVILSFSSASNAPNKMTFKDNSFRCSRGIPLVSVNHPNDMVSWPSPLKPLMTLLTAEITSIGFKVKRG